MLINRRTIKPLFVIITVVAAILCLCACGGDGGSDNGDNRVKPKLDTPQNVRMQSSNGLSFVWDEVALSDGYTVDINGKQFTVTDAYINVKEVGVTANNYVAKVMANSANADCADSDWSQEYSVTTRGYSTNVSSDGSGYVITGGNSIKGNLFIPSRLGGVPIVRIGGGAFQNNTELTDVILPEMLKEIGQFAFKGCSNLTSIHIPRDVKRLSNDMFRECESLKELTVDPENTAYRSAGNCIIKRSTNQVVAGCAGSVIPTDVESINRETFMWVYGLKKITIPSNIKIIEDRTFSWCKDLEEIEISAETQSIPASAFRYCNLKKITVDEDNPVYRSENNCLVQGNTLVLGCAESVIPPDIEVIGEDAFDTAHIDNVIIPSNVANIKKYAFCNNDLKSVVIENGVKIIGEAAFAYCPNLERIYVPTSVTSIGKDAFLPYSEQVYTEQSDKNLSWPSATTVVKRSCAVTVFSENDVSSSRAYYHKNNSELEVENNYPYVVSYYLKKTIKGLTSDHENSDIKYIFGALDEYKAFAPYRMGYTFGGWTVERGGTVAVTKDNTVDDLETFTKDGEEYVRVYAIWHKD